MSYNHTPATLELALQDPKAISWHRCEVQEVLDGYCAILTHYNLGDEEIVIESPVVSTVQELIHGLLPILCWGTSVSQYQKYNPGVRFVMGLKNLITILGNPYYFWISGHYAYSPDDNIKTCRVLPGSMIALQVAEALDPPKPKPFVVDDYIPFW